MTTRPKKIAVLYLGAVFTAGAVFGMAAYRFYAVNTARADFQVSQLSPHELRDRTVKRLEAELGLSPEQSAQVRETYDYIGERWHDVRDAMEPEFEAMRKERADRIMAILNPEQQQQYRDMLEEKRLKREAQVSGRCY
jgi:hypothetical protein